MVPSENFNPRRTNVFAENFGLGSELFFLKGRLQSVNKILLFSNALVHTPHTITYTINTMIDIKLKANSYLGLKDISPQTIMFCKTCLASLLPNIASYMHMYVTAQYQLNLDK